MTSTIDPKEIEHFSKDSDHWWDEAGPFAPLHKLNPLRLTYIRAQIVSHYSLDNDASQPFKKLQILDVGCGGGLVCEPVARLGGNVTGIDADANAITVATEHAKESALKIDYQNIAAEDIKSQFDVVLALEIIEHVADVEGFVESCVKLCKPDGLIIFSTLNRTPQSFALGVVAAEYIMRWVPKGTHQWKKFIRPSELARMIRHAGAKEKNVKGLRYSPVKADFALSDSDMSVNYFMTAEKI